MLKSIIFNQHQVNHALKNKEGMFRVVVKPQPFFKENCFFFRDTGYSVGLYNLFLRKILQDNPYQIGETIFVKESFWQFGGYDSGYDCDEPKFIGSNKITFSEEEATKTQTLNKAWKKRPAQHMKQEHSRLTLRIKSVKVERLQDISEEDAIKEGFAGGCCQDFIYLHDGNYGQVKHCCKFTSAQRKFAVYWNSTHKKPEEKWEANPWVWCFNYEVINNA